MRTLLFFLLFAGLAYATGFEQVNPVLIDGKPANGKVEIKYPGGVLQASFKKGKWDGGNFLYGIPGMACEFTGKGCTGLLVCRDSSISIIIPLKSCAVSGTYELANRSSEHRISLVDGAVQGPAFASIPIEGGRMEYEWTYKRGTLHGPALIRTHGGTTQIEFVDDKITKLIGIYGDNYFEIVLGDGKYSGVLMLENQDEREMTEEDMNYFLHDQGGFGEFRSYADDAAELVEFVQGMTNVLLGKNIQE